MNKSKNRTDLEQIQRKNIDTKNEIKHEEND